MAGDEIVADWLGETYSQSYTTSSTTVNKFYNTCSRRYRGFHIYNPDAANSICIGQYYPFLATFLSKAIYLRPLQNIKLEFVDLYTLGYVDPGANVTFKVLGTNEY
jgi:hypothetical protein